MRVKFENGPFVIHLAKCLRISFYTGKSASTLSSFYNLPRNLNSTIATKYRRLYPYMPFRRGTAGISIWADAPPMKSGVFIILPFHYKGDLQEKYEVHKDGYSGERDFLRRNYVCVKKYLPSYRLFLLIFPWTGVHITINPSSNSYLCFLGDLLCNLILSDWDQVTIAKNGPFLFWA